MAIMTYDEIAALISSGDWKDEIIAENETAEFTKNINKFQYFTLEAYYSNAAGEESSTKSCLSFEESLAGKHHARNTDVVMRISEIEIVVHQCLDELHNTSPITHRVMK